MSAFLLFNLAWVLLEADSPFKAFRPELGPGESPYEITAEEMIWDSKANIARFSGKVSFHRGKLNIECGAMEIRLDKKGAVAGLTASGGVKIAQGEWRAEAARAEYSTAEDVLTLTGAPRITGLTAGGFVEGEKIVIEPGRQNVRVIGARTMIRLKATEPAAGSAGATGGD